MFDHVRFHESYNFPEEGQTKSLDCYLCDIVIGEDSITVDNHPYKYAEVIDVYIDRRNVYVLVNKGKVLAVIQDRKGQMSTTDLTCPECDESGYVYIVGNEINCGSCKQMLKLTSSEK